tara:strand:+ start:587 stop:742 length:156 start_codon:yes stop_codon:yes gene_type:complete
LLGVVFVGTFADANLYILTNSQNDAGFGIEQNFMVSVGVNTNAFCADETEA